MAPVCRKVTVTCPGCGQRVIVDIEVGLVADGEVQVTGTPRPHACFATHGSEERDG